MDKQVKDFLNSLEARVAHGLTEDDRAAIRKIAEDQDVLDNMELVVASLGAHGMGNDFMESHEILAMNRLGEAVEARAIRK